MNRHWIPSLHPTALACWILACSAPLLAHAAEPTGKQWAVLISVQDHNDKSLNLQFTTRDAQSVRKTLMERARIPNDQILEFSALAPGSLRPTRKNIQDRLPEFLAQVKKEDRLLVFFSGHGVEDKGAMYFVPRDADRKNIAGSCIASSWVRKAIQECAATTKFLVLDCCHAGGAEKAIATATSEMVAKSLSPRQMPGCMVLASCRSSESSWEWNEKRHGLFTYWLCRALEGGADENADGRVTGDEVYNYCEARVRQTANRVMRRDQTPVRMLGEDVVGNPPLLVLTPEPTESVCRRLAEQLDVEIRYRELKKVGVLEFLSPLGRVSQALIPANYPKYCTAEVRAALKELAGDAYEVVGESDLDSAAKGIRVEEISDPVALRRLGTRADGMDSVITGTLEKNGRKLHVQCKLVRIEDGERLARPTSVLALSEDGLGDWGESFNNTANDPNTIYKPGVNYQSHLVTTAMLAIHDGPPQLQDDYPFKVEVWSIKATSTDTVTAKTKRVAKQYFKKPTAVALGRENDARTDLLIRARQGELFEIRIWNHSKERVGLALMIDGLNTLGQKRQRLEDARLWVIEPTPKDRPSSISGWYITKAKQNGVEDFERRRFVFTEVSQSVAGRAKFTGSIGLITAAFYREGTGRDLGVGEAQVDPERLNTKKFKRSRLLGVTQIRYVDERDIE